MPLYSVLFLSTGVTRISPSLLAMFVLEELRAQVYRSLFLGCDVAHRGNPNFCFLRIVHFSLKSPVSICLEDGYGDVPEMQY